MDSVFEKHTGLEGLVTITRPDPHSPLTLQGQSDAAEAQGISATSL